ncbi:metal-sensitive transcriptional regulator [Saccharopolyspora sp. ID03-671]|uniref:metal-sensitive transcriptional regulator n=1 Tax=Saccharopolyspora sp. ID03-671 TaxID=3073066 RepID=UPI003873CBFD
MVEEDKYCIDVLAQVSAVLRTLKVVSIGRLDVHLRHCLAEVTASNDKEAEVKVSGQRSVSVPRASVRAAHIACGARRGRYVIVGPLRLPPRGTQSAAAQADANPPPTCWAFSSPGRSHGRSHAKPRPVPS